MARKIYTNEQKAEIIKKAKKTSISAASKEFGVTRMTIGAWMKEAAAKKKPRAGKKAAQKKALAAEAEKVVRATAEQVAAKEKKAGGLVIIQSAFGNEITPEDIRARVGEVDAVYVRVDQNRAYWVKGEETGSVELW